MSEWNLKKTGRICKDAALKRCSIELKEISSRIRDQTTYENGILIKECGKGIRWLLTKNEYFKQHAGIKWSDEDDKKERLDNEYKTIKRRVSKDNNTLEHHKSAKSCIVLTVRQLLKRSSSTFKPSQLSNWSEFWITSREDRLSLSALTDSAP